jgi:hypothetical protein
MPFKMALEIKEKERNVGGKEEVDCRKEEDGKTHRSPRLRTCGEGVAESRALLAAALGTEFVSREPRMKSIRGLGIV